jgi:hypothetical protein
MHNIPVAEEIWNDAHLKTTRQLIFIQTCIHPLVHPRRSEALTSSSHTSCIIQAHRCQAYHEFNLVLEGRALAMDSQTPARMPALMLNRSSRVMPGLRGTPAGITTRSQPASALSMVSVSSRLLGVNALTLADVFAWERSTPTPADGAATS